MAILGIDYGAKKIGLAKSDEQNKFALPLAIIKSGNRTEILNRLREICREEKIEKIVIGVPISMKAEKRDIFLRQLDLQNKQMQEVLNFVDFIKLNLELPVEIEDERLSSKMANTLGRGLIPKGTPDDAVAAMLILQTYLDKVKSQN